MNHYHNIASVAPLQMALFTRGTTRKLTWERQQMGGGGGGLVNMGANPYNGRESNLIH